MTAPPAPAKKPVNWTLIFLILGAGLCVILALCGLAGYGLYRAAQEDPKPRKGFGNPAVLNQLPGGWARYRFSDVPMDVDLPAKPLPEKLEFVKGESFLYREWIFYTIETDLGMYWIQGHWYSVRDFADPKEDLELMSDDFESTPESYANFKHEIGRRSSGMVEGWEMKGRYKRYDEAAESRTFAFAKGKMVMTVHVEYYTSESAAAVAEYERIVDSLQLK